MKFNGNEPKKISPIDVTVPYRLGKNPEIDAWYTAFFLENHLDHESYPEHVATPEQVRFMVYTEEEERFYPCTDRMFEAIINRKKSVFLREKYQAVFKRILELIDKQIESKWEKEYLSSLIRIKFNHETRDQIMIPSRLEKRLFRIFINRSQIEDPFLCEKALRNLRASKALHSEAFQNAHNRIDASDLKNRPPTLTGIRELVEHLELRRLFSVSVEKSIWETNDAATYTESDYFRLFNRKITGNGFQPLLQLLGIHGEKEEKKVPRSKKILWLTNESGEVIVDLAIVRYLTKLGHKVIIAFKEVPFYTKVDFYDAQSDETLRNEIEDALFIKEKVLSKNEVVKILRSDRNIIVISDGTGENLNLLLASTVFARMFKEADAVVTRGQEQKRRIFETHFQFTGDIFNISEDSRGGVSIRYKPKHPSAIKFSHGDLEKKAKTIIDRMEDAKKKRMTVIFYSGIIGSMPGKLKMAKKIVTMFIEYLKSQLSMTLIINPSEYYEPGMDADDLMYMWEIVQRSGLIDIWRFQTYNDIEKAFQIMGKKVPPEWIGKDATFSTGCTKEMKIALEVQQSHPEMQIMGPSKEKFMRRDEYGVGKMYDQRLSEICKL